MPLNHDDDFLNDDFGFDGDGCAQSAIGFLLIIAFVCLGLYIASLLN
jgi:hypothetical protein